MTEREAKIIADKHRLKSRGFVHPIWTVQAAHRANLPLSQACALLQMETGNGRNIFGHDPTSSIPNSWKGSNVNRVKYWYYKRRRGSNGMQGVGPCQLTWWQTQDRADAIGGCWRPYQNMVIGFESLSGLISQHGIEGGAAAYNGAGAAAVTYGKLYVERANHWHTLFAKD